MSVRGTKPRSASPVGAPHGGAREAGGETSPDVARLFGALGVPAHPYHEIASSAEDRAACERWALLAATHEVLRIEQTKSAGAERSPRIEAEPLLAAGGEGVG